MSTVFFLHLLQVLVDSAQQAQLRSGCGGVGTGALPPPELVPDWRLTATAATERGCWTPGPSYSHRGGRSFTGTWSILIVSGQSYIARNKGRLNSPKS